MWPFLSTATAIFGHCRAYKIFRKVTSSDFFNIVTNQIASWDATRGGKKRFAHDKMSKKNC